MRYLLVPVFILFFGFVNSQNRDQFIGTWDMVSKSSDGTTIYLKKRHRYVKDRMGQNQYYRFEKTGKFSIGPIFHRCGNNTGRLAIPPKSWKWNSDEKQLTLATKINKDYIVTNYQVLQVSSLKLVLKKIQSI